MRPALRLAALVSPCLLWLLASGCLRVDLPRPPTQELYTLDSAPSPAPLAGGATIQLSDPRAAPGLEGRSMVFLERAHEVRHYARSAWAEPPARMLAPLLARALERGGFRVVPGGEPGQHLLLETELLQLRQEFLSRPSQVRVALRFRLLGPGGALLEEREVEVSEAAPSDDAYGCVIAANRAVASALADLVARCAEVSARRADPTAPAGPAVP